VAAYLHHASHRIRLFTLAGAAAGEVALPGYGSVDAISGRPEDHAFHFTFTTFTAPTAVFRHDIPTAETALVRPPGVDIDASRLRTEQIFVTSRDGTRVPMFLVHRADVTPDGRRPTLLYGYGGFDIALTPGFAISRHVWVERGGVLAIANLRGGGEYGKEWHDAGRLANKQNVFDDAVACAEWLTGAGGWTRPERLAIQGGSNGGLLVGACMTQRPDLFGACVPEVGVMDMLRFHRFTIGWGWTSDYGCADDPEQFAWLHAYSPLHNLRTGTAYPATLVTTGDHDDRVVPGHSFKFAAALQAAQGGDAPALIRIETQAGHGAGKPTGKLIEERTDVLSFLERALGVAGP
jgi:prolyl oligopeptidase